MKKTMKWIGLLMTSLLCAGSAAVTAAEERSLMDQVLDRVVAKESRLIERLAEYTPLVETYLQTLEPDRELGTVPLSDDYFFGRLNFSREAHNGPAGTGSDNEEKLLDLFKEFYGRSHQPDGFARMMVLDPDSFDRDNYDFEFVRREFLGEIRTLVFEVIPKMKDRPRRFIGRIWVDDEDYNIVRYNGIYSSKTPGNLHFDSWRLNTGADFWYPAYVYTEESEFRRNGQLKRKLKGQTRIWGYEIQRKTSAEEFTKIMLESPQATDSSDQPGRVSPVEDLRAWEREAEDNVLQRLEKGGIIAPAGDVDKVLETVTANLEVTNSLNIEPAIRCRVLLTTPLESFTVGHTIVLSRGLIDVLPDEASLAMVLAHEMGHIIMGHQLDTKYAFSDQMLVGDKQAMDQFFFKRIPEEEAEADEKAVMLLENSPYKDQIGNAGLFLKALSARAHTLPALIRSHFGNRMASRGKLARMNRLTDSAPELYETALNQTAALPLGSRVKLDPWTAQIELMNGNQVVLLSPREKLPFEVTPLMPHLVRQRSNLEGAMETRPKTTGGQERDRPTKVIPTAAPGPAIDPLLAQSERQ